MKTNFKFIMIALFTLALTSCSPEDGKDGMDGEQGIPGEDGNANVTSYLFKNIIFPDGVSEPIYIQAINQDILENGVVLGYLHQESTPGWYPLPFITEFDNVTIYIIAEGVIYLNSTAETQPVDLKIVVIKGNPGNGGKSNKGQSSKQAIFDTLKAAGVDINDYDAVVDYYSIKH